MPDQDAAALRCDVPGCADEMCIRIGPEQRCYAHALAKGNELRAARGLPPVTFENGERHVVQ
jgi:hypothetical protein